MIIKKLINLFKKRGNMIVLPILIGEEKYIFLVDTGSENSFISPKKKLIHFKEKLPCNLKVKGIGEDTITKYKYSIPVIFLGDIKIKNVSFIEKKDKNILFKVLRIDGIIGWDILKTIDFQLNFESSKLEAIDIEDWGTAKDSCEFNLLLDTNLPIYSIKNSDDIVQHFLIDTGSNFSYLYIPMYEGKVQMCHSFSIGINGIPLNKLFLVQNYCIPSNDNSLNGFSVKKLFIEKCYSKTPLILGLDAFYGKKIRFVNSEGMLYIEF